MLLLLIVPKFLSFFIFGVIAILSLAFIVFLVVVAIWSWEKVSYHFYQYKRKTWEDKEG